jgi:hypothetical protein
VTNTFAFDRAYVRLGLRLALERLNRLLPGEAFSFEQILKELRDLNVPGLQLPHPLDPLMVYKNLQTLGNATKTDAGYRWFPSPAAPGLFMAVRLGR